MAVPTSRWRGARRLVMLLGHPRRRAAGLAFWLVFALAALSAGSPPAFAAPGWRAEPPSAGASRRAALAWWVAGLAAVQSPSVAQSAPGGAKGPGQPWRQEIPETLQILKGLQDKWVELDQMGLLGGGKIRKILDYELVESLDIPVAAGDPIGAKFANRRVTSVANPSLGWREKDQVLSVNGKLVASQEAMLQRIGEAQQAGKPLLLGVGRTKQSPVDGIEEDLVQAYMTLDMSRLPEIDDVVSHLSAARALAATAASSTRNSGEMLDELKLEIDALVPQFAQIVAAMA